MDFWGLFFIVIIIGNLMVFAINRYVSYKTKEMEKKLESIPEFTVTQKVIGNDIKTGIAIDEVRNKVALVKNSEIGITIKTISYTDLLSAEIFVDGETVTKTARGSQLGGALIGALALGGVGAIIGGLSGKKIASEKIKKIDLRLTINDSKSPLHDINFLDTPHKKESDAYKKALHLARHWLGIIDVLINLADNEDSPHTEVADTKKEAGDKINSLADELLKLSLLRDKGILSDEEFTNQKNKLLS